MRFLLAIFAVWVAIVVFPERSPADNTEEKVFLSRTCADSKWYLVDSDDQSVTVACYQSSEER